MAFSLPVGVMIEMGVIDPPLPGPGPFALGEDEVLAGLVSAAGFTDVRVDTAVAVYELPSREACTQWFRDVAPPITELVAGEPDNVVQPVLAGHGPTLLAGLRESIQLELVDRREFGSAAIALRFRPTRAAA